MSNNRTEPYGVMPGSQLWNGVVCGGVSAGVLTPVRLPSGIASGNASPGPARIRHCTTIAQGSVHIPAGYSRSCSDESDAPRPVQQSQILVQRHGQTAPKARATCRRHARGVLGRRSGELDRSQPARTTSLFTGNGHRRFRNLWLRIPRTFVTPGGGSETTGGPPESRSQPIRQVSAPSPATTVRSGDSSESQNGRSKIPSAGLSGTCSPEYRADGTSRTRKNFRKSHSRR